MSPTTGEPLPLQPPPREKMVQLSAMAFEGDEDKLKREAQRLGYSVRELTAWIFRWWLEELEKTQPERSRKR